ncbi:MAG: hypothetical protein HY788_03405 [Deltaproteobacteria bacterium]|nr:hypothetical protein [Deltaproteobacteria bacterium]
MEAPPVDFPFRSALSLKPMADYLGRKSGSGGMTDPSVLSDLRIRLENAPELLGPIEDLTVLDRYDGLIEDLMSAVFSPIFLETQLFAAVVPYHARPFYASPQFRRMLLNEDGSYAGRFVLDRDSYNRGRIARAYLIVLERLCGIKHPFDFPLIRIVPDPQTELERYFKLNLDFRFVEVRSISRSNEISAEEAAEVLKHITDPEALRVIMPPEEFEFSGLTLFHAVDVTESEVLADLEKDIVDQTSLLSEGGFSRLEERLRTFFRNPRLKAGLAAIRKREVILFHRQCEAIPACVLAGSSRLPVSRFDGTVFERVVLEDRTVIVPDLMKEPPPDDVVKDLLSAGERSLLIAPLKYKGECVGILCLKSAEPEEFGPLEAMVVGVLQPLFSMAVKNLLEEMEHQIQSTIKEQCTALHPAVEWRFQKAALNRIDRMRLNRSAEMEPIVFKGVYPFYGVSDIRGSSDERNRALQEDLTAHLHLARKVLDVANDAKPLPILQELSTRLDDQIHGLRTGIGSGDEIRIVRLIQDEIEPVFHDIRGFGIQVGIAIEAYHSSLDGNVGTVYERRKAFEHSVAVLNERLAVFLDGENAKLQAMCPHYFERHRTDGVDYLIYMGKSLLENGEFNDLYLKNMRLWQLKLACGMAQINERIKPGLEVPLETAHLILVQDAPLSIRFRYDEKRFDVDGAYDLRYEIVRSRLDKALIRGGRERLTQPGKVSVVYAHAEEGRETERHIDFLRSTGQFAGKTEYLDLEDLPGVRGLKAMRVKVNLPSHEEGAGTAGQTPVRDVRTA